MLPTVASTEISGKLLGADCVVAVGLVPNRDTYVCSNKYNCLKISHLVTDLGWGHVHLVLHSHPDLNMNRYRMVARRRNHSGNSFGSNRLVNFCRC